MKRTMIALAAAAVTLLPAASEAAGTRPVPKITLTCPSSTVATDALRDRFDGYHEQILWAWADHTWNELCPLQHRANR